MDWGNNDAPGRAPAHLYGVREGDIIIEAEDHPVRKVGDLRRILEESIEKGAVKLRIIRDHRAFELEVPIAVEEEG